MKKILVPMALAASVALAGISAASAMDSASKSTTGSSQSDTLNLSSSQQKTLWNDISANAAKQQAPSSFNATIGEALPSSLTSHALPSKAATDVPAAKDYQYVMMQNKLLLVNPSDKRVAEVITQ